MHVQFCKYFIYQGKTCLKIWSNFKSIINSNKFYVIVHLPIYYDNMVLFYTFWFIHVSFSSEYNAPFKFFRPYPPGTPSDITSF